MEDAIVEVLSKIAPWLDEDNALYVAPMFVEISGAGDDATELIADARETLQGLGEEFGVDAGDVELVFSGLAQAADLNLSCLGGANEQTEKESSVDEPRIAVNLAEQLQQVEKELREDASRDGREVSSIDGLDGRGVDNSAAVDDMKKKSKKASREESRESEQQKEAWLTAEAEMAAQARVVSSFDVDDVDDSEENVEGNILLEKFSVPSKAAGEGDLISEASLTLVTGRRYALVGKNGTGKTTLLEALAARRIAGIPKRRSILHVRQEISGDISTPLQFVMRADGPRQFLCDEISRLERSSDDEMLLARYYEQLARYEERLGAAEPRARAILSGLGFSEKMISEATSNLSGGWRMRVALACALYVAPSILLLDEPSNHLDLEAILFLVEFLTDQLPAHALLKGFQGTLVVVSHDRNFLDEVVTDVVSLERRQLSVYRGNFSAFQATREQLKVRQQKQREAQEAKRAHLQEFIDEHAQLGSNGVKDAAQRKSRMKKLARLGTEAASANEGRRHKASYDGIAEQVEEVQEESIDFEVKLPDPGVVEGHIVQLSGLSFSYPGSPVLFSDVDLQLGSDTRLGILGPNGAGKSTLIKLLLGNLEPTAGNVSRSPFGRIGYLAQHTIEMLDPHATPMEMLRRLDPGDSSRGHMTKLRGYLAQFGLGGNTLPHQKIFTLSGGQKFRICLAIIMHAQPHLLIFDEPTNHVDFETSDSLISALKAFQGGIVVVSHEAYLLSQVCDSYLVVNEGTVEKYAGSFEDYVRRLKRVRG